VPTALLVVVSALALIAGAYAFHRLTAPRAPKSREKLLPYACGELLPLERISVRVRLFKYACLFLVVDIVSLLLAFVVGDAAPYHELIRYLATAYGAVALAAVTLAVTE